MIPSKEKCPPANAGRRFHHSQQRRARLDAIDLGMTARRAFLVAAPFWWIMVVIGASAACGACLAGQSGRASLFF
jgi:hypothetical protein